MKEVNALKQLFSSILLALLLSASFVLALHAGAYAGYAGTSARERREYDPYSRVQYFGEDYLLQRQFGGFGLKGPTTGKIISTGFKSGYSSVFNLDTNDFSRRGRDPSRISNVDPGVRGFARLDVSVELLPYDPVTVERDLVERLTRATARLVSDGGVYGQGFNSQGPQSRVMISARDLLPIDQDFIYEAWLSDEDSGYTMSIGLLKSGVGGTSRLDFYINRQLQEFDFVLVTKEAFPDFDPQPSEIVLLGEIPKPRSALAPPASQIPVTQR